MNPYLMISLFWLSVVVVALVLLTNGERRNIARRFFRWVYRDEGIALNMKSLLVTMMLAFVGVMFVLGITPSIESAPTTNITNTTTLNFITIIKWALPVGGLVACLFGIFKLFGGSGKGT